MTSALLSYDHTEREIMVYLEIKSDSKTKHWNPSRCPQLNTKSDRMSNPIYTSVKGISGGFSAVSSSILSPTPVQRQMNADFK